MSNQSAQDAAVAQRPRSFFARAAAKLFCWRTCRLTLGWLLVVAVCLPSWAAFAADSFWLCELATHFVWQYCSVLPLILAISWRAGTRGMTWLVAITLLLNVWRAGPLLLPPAESPGEGPNLRVMVQNVLAVNRNHEPLLELIRREQPDVFVLVEVRPHWIEALKPLEADYPHRAVKLRGTRSGVALWSRYPLEEVRWERFSMLARYAAVARVQVEGRSVTLIGMHPSLPRRPLNLTWRNDDLLGAAKLAASTPGSVVLLGDLNTTPWSPVFDRVINESGLRNSMQGFAPQPTWKPRNAPVALPLLLPIDHVLHSPDWAVIDRRIGPDVGSDHRAVIVDLAPTVEQP